MTTMSTALATQVYHVFIRSNPEAIWEAITMPEFTEKYWSRPPTRPRGRTRPR